jgi:hypothetical protein
MAKKQAQLEAERRAAKVEDIANRLVQLVKDGALTSQEKAMDFVIDEAVDAGVDREDVERHFQTCGDLDFNMWGEYCDRHRTLHDCRGEEE